MTTTPVISVIVPTFNRPDLLARALNSIAAQQLAAELIEVIVINDAGESPHDVINDFASRNAALRVQCIDNAHNLGRPRTRNVGIAAARGEFIAFLDDDDLMYPNHLSTLLENARSAPGIIPYTDAIRASENEHGVTTREMLERPGSFSLEKLLVRNYIQILSVLVPRAMLDEVGLFDERLEALEDWELWLRLSTVAEFRYVHHVTAEYRVRTGTANSTTRELPTHHRCVELVYATHPLPVDSPLHSLRANYAAQARHALRASHPFEWSILIASNGDAPFLLDQLGTIVQQIGTESFEVLVHTPRSPEMTALRAQIDGDIEFVYGDCDDESVVWGILERRKAGRKTICITGAPGVEIPGGVIPVP